jgi:hypothetical protein
MAPHPLYDNAPGGAAYMGTFKHGLRSRSNLIDRNKRILMARKFERQSIENHLAQKFTSESIVNQAQQLAEGFRQRRIQAEAVRQQQESRSAAMMDIENGPSSAATAAAAVSTGASAAAPDDQNNNNDNDNDNDNAAPMQNSLAPDRMLDGPNATMKMVEIANGTRPATALQMVEIANGARRATAPSPDDSPAMAAVKAATAAGLDQEQIAALARLNGISTLPNMPHIRDVPGARDVAVPNPNMGAGNFLVTYSREIMKDVRTAQQALAALKQQEEIKKNEIRRTYQKQERDWKEKIEEHRNHLDHLRKVKAHLEAQTMEMEKVLANSRNRGQGNAASAASRGSGRSRQ